jgi:hypothetical protein
MYLIFCCWPYSGQVTADKTMRIRAPNRLTLGGAKIWSVGIGLRTPAGGTNGTLNSRRICTIRPCSVRPISANSARCEISIITSATSSRCSPTRCRLATRGERIIAEQWRKRGIERSEMALIGQHDRERISPNDQTFTDFESVRRTTEPSRCARSPSSGPIGRSSDRPSFDGLGATFPRKGGKGVRPS